MYQSTHTGAQIDDAVDKALSVDAVPTQGSTKLVTSGGVYGLVSNRNILDNGWFTVNQRGLTSYAWNGVQYSVDRWKWDTLATAPLEVQSDGVNLNGSALTAGNPYMRQIIDNPTAYRGKTMTFSAIVSAVSGASNKGYLRVYSGSGTAWGVYIGTDTGLWTATFTVPADATAFFCDIGVYTGKTVKVVAAKLELGTVSTLANDAPPCFAEELAKCQYYFRRIANNKSNAQWCMTGMNASAQVGIFVLDNRMRAVDKTITQSGTLYVNGQTVTSITSITRNQETTLNCVTSGLTAYGGAGLAISAGGYLDISADL